MGKFLQGNDVSFWVAKQPDDVTTTTYNELPRASGNVSINRTYTDDTTISSERMSRDSALTDVSVSGDITANVRLSEHYKVLRQGALQSCEPEILNITAALTYTHLTGVVAGGDFSTVKEGYYFGLLKADGSKVAVVAAADGTATDVQISGLDKDDAFTGAYAERYTSSDNQLPMMIQKRAKGIDDLGAEKVYYQTYKGAEVFSYTQSISQGSILTESFSLTGIASGEVDTTYSKPTQGDDVAMKMTDTLAAVKGVESVWFNGAKRGCFAQSLELSIDNQGTESKAIGQMGACSLGYGDPIITASASVYSLKSDPFEYDKLSDSQVKFPFAYVLSDVAENKKLAISGVWKSTATDSPPEQGDMVNSLSLKLIGQIAFTYI